MRYFFVLLSLLYFLFSCSKVEKEYVLKIKLTKLDEATLYDKQLAGDMIFDSEEQNVDSLKTKSRQLFLQGIQQFKNKKSPEKAVEMFKASILTFPEAKTYYELGNALMELGGFENVDEAIKAYEVTEYLGFQPISNVLYNKSRAEYSLYANPFVLDELASNQEEAKKDYLDQAVNSLRQAFMEGFYDTTRLKTDPVLRNIIQHPDFKSFFVYYTAQRLKGDNNGLFSLFTQSFPSLGSQFEVRLENVSLDDHKQSISYDFAPYISEMENVGFGRDVSNDFFYVGKLTPTSHYSSVIYRSVKFYGEGSQPVHTTLATYDSQGKIISKILMSCVCSSTKVKTGKVEDGTITIEEFKRNWREPIDKVAFDDNAIVGHDPIAKAIYRIDESGKIVEESVPEELKDSTATSSTKRDEIKN
jgi:hypothetical protein